MTTHLHFGKWADEAQQENGNIIQAFLKLNRWRDLGVLMIVLAFLPALGEELVFRGVLLRVMHRRISRALGTVVIGKAMVMPDAERSMVFPVVSTAFLFAAMHFSNPYGLLFIFIAGCLLALIYSLTVSLLFSMWAHFLYNGTQVAAVFLTQHNATAQKVAEGENLPVIYPLLGLALFVGCFYALVKNQTPLPADWSDDFKGEEIA